MSKRNLLILFVATVILTLAMAVPAFAKSTTKLSNSVSVDAVSYRGTATLQYSKSGHYRALSGAYIRTYRYKGGHWVYVRKTKTNSKGQVTVTLPSGYKYRLYYAGSSTKRPDWSTTLSIKLVPTLTAIAKWGAFDAQTTQPSEEATINGSLGYGQYADGLPVVGATVSILKKDANGIYAPFTTVVTTTNKVFEDISYSNWEVVLGVGEYKAFYAGDSKRKSCGYEFTVGYPEAEGYIEANQVETNDWNYFNLTSGGTTAIVTGSATIYSGFNGLPVNDMPLGSTIITIRKSNGDWVSPIYEPFTTITTDADGKWSAELPTGDYIFESATATDYLALDGFHYDMFVGEVFIHVLPY